MKIKSKVSIIDNEIPEAQNEVENRDHEENIEDKTINNENPEAQNEDENLDHEEHTEDENLDHEEHTEDENLDHEEHTEDDLAPRNKTNLTPVTVFSQTQPSQNL